MPMNTEQTMISTDRSIDRSIARSRGGGRSAQWGREDEAAAILARRSESRVNVLFGRHGAASARTRGVPTDLVGPREPLLGRQPRHKELPPAPPIVSSSARQSRILQSRRGPVGRVGRRRRGATSRRRRAGNDGGPVEMGGANVRRSCRLAWGGGDGDDHRLGGVAREGTGATHRKSPRSSGSTAS